MRLEALCQTLRTAGAADRAQAVGELSGARLEGALFGVLVIDPSLQVRNAALAALARRSPERQTEAPPPEGAISERQRLTMIEERAEDAAFVSVLLTSGRGRDLLARVDLERSALDAFLIELAAEADATTLREVLTLPLDVSGRGVTLLRQLPQLPAPSRDVVLDLLTWSALQTGMVIDELERERAQDAIRLWVRGLLSMDPEDAAQGPDLDQFLAGGASLGRGVVTETADDLDAPTAAALRPLGRLLHLTLCSARAPLLERAPLEEDLGHDSAELRVTAWRLLAENGLADPEEVLEAARAEARGGVPGAAYELLEVLPSSLPPRLAGGLVELLTHARASVRRAAVRALTRDPLVAALASAGIDPRDPHAPLEVLAAQPSALAAPALVAFLEVERPAGELAAALERLARPPSPSWPRWEWLLNHGNRRVRRAAQRALLALPASEGPAVAPFLPFVLDDAPARALAIIERFGLPDLHADVARILLDEGVSDSAAEAATRVLVGYGDAAAWTILWTFVVGARRAGQGPGGASRYRFGSRRARARTLDALLALRPPSAPLTTDAFRPYAPVLQDLEGALWTDASGAGSGPGAGLDSERAAHPEAPALAALLADRDPHQAGLALRYMTRHGVPAQLLDPLYDLTQDTLVAALRPAGAWGWRRRWSRALRRLLPAAWVWPSFSARRGGRALVRLLERLLDFALRTGVGGLLADDVEPLLRHPDPGLRRGAVHLYLTLRGARSLGDLVAHEGEDVAREAIQVGHPDQVEALVFRALSRARRRRAREDLARALAWVQLRPRPSYVDFLGRLLREDVGRRRGARGSIVDALLAIADHPRGRSAVRGVLEEELERASASRDQGALRDAVDLLERLTGSGQAWDLVPRLLPAITWAREGARKRLVALVRAAHQAGSLPDPGALTPLLQHPLVEVRVFALSMLRKAAAEEGAAFDLWPLLRPAGPSPGAAAPLSTDFAKPFLGACEDAYRDEMGLTLEAFLAHPNGEVARRALKLINRREREVATLALLRHAEDPELQQPILTAFSSWSARFLDADQRLSPELLEDERRQLRATLRALAVGGRAQAAAALAGAWESPVVYLRAAALFAVGRLLLAEEAPRVRAGLDDPDPLLRRCAAYAAGCLAAAAGPSREGPAGEGPAGEDPADDDGGLGAALAGAADARQPEVRAAARRALVAHLDPDHDDLRGEVEGLLADPSPEVRLAALQALAARGELLARLPLGAHLADPDPRARELVLRVLERQTPNPSAGPGRGPGQLRAPLSDPVPEVRLAALATLARWGETLGAEVLEPVRQEVGELLSDPSIHVSGAALDLLTGLGQAPPAEEPETAGDRPQEASA